MAKVESTSSKKLSAIYVFGDSTVDPGNNNNLYTLVKSNFAPYGMDFPNQVATGRFTNGKLTTDYIGVKKELLPPYLDSKLRSMEDLMTGNVIPMAKQLEYFRECKRRLEGSKLGKEGTESHMQKAIFVISAATNDFVVNYFTLPIRRSYTLFTYQHFLIQHVKDFVQNLWKEGGRRIAVVGLPPMGCLPIMITSKSNNSFKERGCIDKYSSIARDYNQMLQQELQSLQLNLPYPGAKVYYIDIYQPLADMVQHHEKYGFDEVNKGCCGSGYIEASFLCNNISLVCSDPSKYVFWDSIHPTQEAYHNIFLAARSTIDFIINDH
ncbi:GDSL esterase/lipase [Senna tora]|uniref:GDSL esterase/lipase n=1 Tax=Senna tora TaxID=362788 RepID=A0A834TP12_9FABA|nr:GDSL esterase/lipase [Senna tora]